MDRDQGIEEPVTRCPQIAEITGDYRGSGEQHRLELQLRDDGTHEFHHLHDTADGETSNGVSFGTCEISSQNSLCFVQLIPSNLLFLPDVLGPGQGPVLFVPPMQIEGSGRELALRFPLGGEPPRPDIILRRVVDSPGEPLDT
jgi:hypothetical protein